MPAPRDKMWLLELPDSLVESGERGLQRAESGDWDSGPADTRADDLRSWLAVHAFVESRLVGSVVVNESRGVLELDPTLPGSDAPRERIARALRGTVRLLALNDNPGYCAEPIPRVIATSQTAESDTGALPAIAAVAVYVAASAAVAYVAHQAAQVVDNVLARKAKLREVMQADAQALRVIERHVAREQEAGETLPLDAASKRALDELERRQRQLAEKRTAPVDPGVRVEEGGSLFGSWSMFFLGAAAALGAALAVKS